LKGFWHGHVELLLAGTKYKASYEVVDDMIHLTVVDKRTFVVDPLPGATNQESALHALEQYATGNIRARD
jgi:hypothetical protein